MRVLLIAGGWSQEREVALSGARKIREALETLGHEVDFLDPALEFAELTRRAAEADFAFINLHGAPGEDGLIQALLEETGCPYQGSGPKASFLALDKAASKLVFLRRGLPTPKFVFVPLPPAPDWEPDLTYPLFIKPNTGGSSIGMGLARTREDLERALGAVFAMGETALIEEAAPGPEITCAVLDETPLPPILIRPAGGHDFFDYESKYEADGAEEICPAPIPDELTARIQELSLDAHRALGLRGCSRADFIMEGEEPLLLEVNTLPGMTPTSLLPQAAAAAGYDFAALIARLMELGLAAHPRS